MVGMRLENGHSEIQVPFKIWSKILVQKIEKVVQKTEGPFKVNDSPFKSKGFSVNTKT